MLIAALFLITLKLLYFDWTSSKPKSHLWVQYSTRDKRTKKERCNACAWQSNENSRS